MSRVIWGIVIGLVCGLLFPFPYSIGLAIITTLVACQINLI